MFKLGLKHITGLIHVLNLDLRSSFDLLGTQLEVQWAYSGHSVHLQWGTVHALHAIYNGHCSYTVARYSVQCPTVGALNAHCMPTALWAGSTLEREYSWFYSAVCLQCTLQRTVCPLALHFELGCYFVPLASYWQKGYLYNAAQKDIMNQLN